MHNIKCNIIWISYEYNWIITLSFSLYYGFYHEYITLSIIDCEAGRSSKRRLASLDTASVTASFLAKPSHLSIARGEHRSIVSITESQRECCSMQYAPQLTRPVGQAPGVCPGEWPQPAKIFRVQKARASACDSDRTSLACFRSLGLGNLQYIYLPKDQSEPCWNLSDPQVLGTQRWDFSQWLQFTTSPSMA